MDCADQYVYMLIRVWVGVNQRNSQDSAEFRYTYI